MIPERLLSLAPWALPPILGAAIGYITNWIAIRMLFRPLEEVRVLGLKLPFTPGIIPKQRRQLADSIGRMVSRELITPEAIRRQIATPAFRLRLEGNLEALIRHLLDTPLVQLQPKNREEVFTVLERFLADVFFRFFSSRYFIHAARRGIANLIRAVVEKPVEELLAQIRLNRGLSGLIERATSAESRHKLTNTVEAWLARRRADSTPLSEYLPDDILIGIAGLIGTLLPALYDALFNYLGEKETRSELEWRGKRLLRDILDKLNLFQKILISATQYDRTLEEKMPEIVDDVLSELERAAREPGNQGKVRSLIQEALLKWSRSETAGILAGLGKLPVETLVANTLRTLESESVREKLGRSIERLAVSLGRRSLREILARYLGVQEQEVVEFTTNQVLQILSKPESSRAIAAEVLSFASVFLEEEPHNTIGDLLHLDEQARGRAAVYLTNRVIAILNRRLPELIESFDIHELVVHKIDQLNIAEVERLLMMVIARHLKWINLFGAILGALIGFSQLALRILS